MIRRCEETTCKSYKDYGAKGIKVCEEWHDPQKFFEWAENNGYKEGLEIDRIDFNGDYYPENCRFVTRLVNANNKSSNHYVNYNGETLSLADMCRKYNFPYGYMNKWIQKGLDFTEAVKRYKSKEEAVEGKKCERATGQ